jgi:hypothetical protein
MSFLEKSLVHLVNSNRERSYVILKQYNLAYGRVPKAANSSIKLALHNLLNGEQPRVPGVNRDNFWRSFPNDLADLLTAAHLTQRNPDTYVFSFTRNPYSRIASCYYSKIINRHKVPILFRFQGFRKDMSFTKFVEKVASIDDGIIDIHLRSQTQILSHQGRILPDFIGRVETIDEDWRRLRIIVLARGGPRFGQLPHINKARDKRPPTSELFFDRGLVRLMTERYRTDFETFYPDMDIPFRQP